MVAVGSGSGGPVPNGPPGASAPDPGACSMTGGLGPDGGSFLGVGSFYLFYVLVGDHVGGPRGGDGVPPVDVVCAPCAFASVGHPSAVVVGPVGETVQFAPFGRFEQPSERFGPVHRGSGVGGTGQAGDPAGAFAIEVFGGGRHRFGGRWR